MLIFVLNILLALRTSISICINNINGMNISINNINIINMAIIHMVNRIHCYSYHFDIATLLPLLCVSCSVCPFYVSVSACVCVSHLLCLNRFLLFSVLRVGVRVEATR